MDRRKIMKMVEEMLDDQEPLDGLTQLWIVAFAGHLEVHLAFSNRLPEVHKNTYCEEEESHG